MADLTLADLDALPPPTAAKAPQLSLDDLPPPPKSAEKPLGGPMDAIIEPVAALASGAVAAPVAGLAGLAQGAKNMISPGTPAADRVEQVENALTIEPHTKYGQAATDIVKYPFKKLAQAGDKAGDVTNESLRKAGVPEKAAAAAGAVVNTAIQSIPAIVAKGAAKIGGAGEAADAGAASAKITTAPKAAAKTPEETAKAYVGSTTNLDWDSLSDSFKSKLTQIAKESGDLSKLDPKSVERVGRAQAVGAPITRGQATRQIPDLTKEELLSRSEAGRPIGAVKTAQDVALHNKLESFRPADAKAETRAQVGESVQGAERAKLRSVQASKRLAYKKAKEAGEMTGPVDISPLEEWLKVPANGRNAGFLKQAINDYKKDASGSIRINDLEEVRKEAVQAAKGQPSTATHYAGQAVSEIDKILDQAGGNLYKNARAAHAAEKQEFARQGLIKKLVSERTNTADRAVALEDTFDSVVRRGSNEQVHGLLKSLTSGGSLKTRKLGAQAVSDLRAAAVDYLKEKASGRRSIKGQDDQLQFNSSFIDAFDELDKDGKIQTLFPDQAPALRQLRDAVHDMRTTPATRETGSPTVNKGIAALEHLGSHSGIPASGLIMKGIKSVHDAATKSKQARQAVTDPVTEAATTSAKKQKQRERYPTLKETEKYPTWPN